MNRSIAAISAVALCLAAAAPALAQSNTYKILATSKTSTMQKEMQDCDQQVAASEEERVWLRKRNAILRSRTIALHAAIHGEDLEHRRELWARGMDTPERALGTWHAGLT